jgi:hypothetical protein
MQQAQLGRSKYKDQIKTQVALHQTSVGDNSNFQHQLQFQFQFQFQFQRLSKNTRAGDSAFVGSRPGLLYEAAARMKSASMP